MPTIFLSLRGDGAPRVLDAFRRALGEEATTLVVVPTNDENGYHGSAEVADIAAAREAFALARKPYPTLKGFLGADSGARFPVNVPTEGRSRGGERPQSDGRRRSEEGRQRPPERAAEATPPGEEQPERGRRRSGSRGRGRGGNRPTPPPES